MEDLKDRMYFDELGNEIHDGDLLRVFHFIGARKRKHYMYKIIGLEKGYWVGREYCSEHTYRLGIVANKATGVINGSRVISRKEYDDDFKQS